MSLNFPSNPGIGQTYGFGDRVWAYGGEGWNLVPRELPQGSQGLQGTQGLSNQGSQGIQGLQGPLSNFQGTQGLQGVQGLPGQGVQGLQGTQGTQGYQGTQGLQGTQGREGAQGRQGTQGRQGAQGISNQGIQGPAGTSQGLQGTQGPASSGGGGSGKFDTSINRSLFVQPTGTLDIVGVGTTTTQIKTLTSEYPKYLVHSLHVSNITPGDVEITAGFIDDSRTVPATVSTGIGFSGGPGIHTITVGSASSIRIGMAVTGTGNSGETTGIGTTAGFRYNTYVTSVDGNVITLDPPMSGYAEGIAYFSPVSRVVSRLPVPANSSVELLKQPMVLDSLDSIVLQSTGITTGGVAGIGSTSTADISQTANSNFLTVNAGAAITNWIASGMLVLGTGSNTGIQTNTFVADNWTPGSLTIPLTRPAKTTVSNASYSFTEVVVPQDGAFNVSISYQTSIDTAYKKGTGTVVGIDTQGFVVGVVTSTPAVYYGTGNTYPSIVQSIRVSNISETAVYPGGDYKVSVGIGNSDTILSWLAYDMTIPLNSSIELCEAPKVLGIGQSIFAAAEEPNTIEIQISAKQNIPT